MTDMDYVTRASSYTRLYIFVETYDWPNAISRLSSHPHEASSRGPRGRTALHVACDHDAPAGLVRALLAAYPEASGMVGTSDMTPLHITCSSQHASVDVVKVLLEGSPTGRETSARDIDGDTPLHAACRCGAPMEVLTTLLEWDPAVVLDRDREGLTPLLRLWVRYTVILGDEKIDAVRTPADLRETSDLQEAWMKTTLLLRVAHHGGVHQRRGELPFREVHAAAALDCPRAVLKIACHLYSHQLVERDEYGRVPLVVACQAPVYKVHDLSENGYYNLEEIDEAAVAANGRRPYREDVEEDYDGGMDGGEHVPPPQEHSDGEGYDTDGGSYQQPPSAPAHQSVPSVIEVILRARPELARVPHVDGRLPLNIALESGKGWRHGVECLLRENPESLNRVDAGTGLYPFMLAATARSGSGGGARDVECVNTVYHLLRANPELVRSGIVYRRDEETKPTSAEAEAETSHASNQGGVERPRGKLKRDDEASHASDQDWVERPRGKLKRDDAEASQAPDQGGVERPRGPLKRDYANEDGEDEMLCTAAPSGWGSAAPSGWGSRSKDGAVGPRGPVCGVLNVDGDESVR